MNKSFIFQTKRFREHCRLSEGAWGDLLEVSWGDLDGLMAGSLYYISILGMSWVGVSSPTHDLAMEVGVLVFIAYRRYLRSATVRVPYRRLIILTLGRPSWTACGAKRPSSCGSSGRLSLGSSDQSSETIHIGYNNYIGLARSIWKGRACGGPPEKLFRDRAS